MENISLSWNQLLADLKEFGDTLKERMRIDEKLKKIAKGKIACSKKQRAKKRKKYGQFKI